MEAGDRVQSLVGRARRVMPQHAGRGARGGRKSEQGAGVGGYGAVVARC